MSRDHYGRSQWDWSSHGNTNRRPEEWSRGDGNFMNGSNWTGPPHQFTHTRQYNYGRDSDRRGYGDQSQFNSTRNEFTVPLRSNERGVYDNYNNSRRETYQSGERGRFQDNYGRVQSPRKFSEEGLFQYRSRGNELHTCSSDRDRERVGRRMNDEITRRNKDRYEYISSPQSDDAQHFSRERRYRYEPYGSRHDISKSRSESTTWKEKENVGGSNSKTHVDRKPPQARTDQSVEIQDKPSISQGINLQKQDKFNSVQKPDRFMCQNKAIENSADNAVEQHLVPDNNSSGKPAVGMISQNVSLHAPRAKDRKIISQQAIKDQRPVDFQQSPLADGSSSVVIQDDLEQNNQNENLNASPGEIQKQIRETLQMIQKNVAQVQAAFKKDPPSANERTEKKKPTSRTTEMGRNEKDFKQRKTPSGKKDAFDPKEIPSESISTSGSKELNKGTSALLNSNEKLKADIKHSSKDSRMEVNFKSPKEGRTDVKPPNDSKMANQNMTCENSHNPNHSLNKYKPRHGTGRLEVASSDKTLNQIRTTVKASNKAKTETHGKDHRKEVSLDKHTWNQTERKTKHYKDQSEENKTQGVDQLLKGHSRQKEIKCTDGNSKVNEKDKDKQRDHQNVSSREIQSNKFNSNLQKEEDKRERVSGAAAVNFSDRNRHETFTYDKRKMSTDHISLTEAEFKRKDKSKFHKDIEYDKARGVANEHEKIRHRGNDYRNGNNELGKCKGRENNQSDKGNVFEKILGKEIHKHDKDNGHENMQTKEKMKSDKDIAHETIRRQGIHKHDKGPVHDKLQIREKIQSDKDNAHETIQGQGMHKHDKDTAHEKVRPKENNKCAKEKTRDTHEHRHMDKKYEKVRAKETLKCNQDSAQANKRDTDKHKHKDTKYEKVRAKENRRSVKDKTHEKNAEKDEHKHKNTESIKVKEKQNSKYDKKNAPVNIKEKDIDPEPEHKCKDRYKQDKDTDRDKVRGKDISKTDKDSTHEIHKEKDKHKLKRTDKEKMRGKENSKCDKDSATEKVRVKEKHMYDKDTVYEGKKRQHGTDEYVRHQGHSTDKLSDDYSGKKVTVNVSDSRKVQYHNEQKSASNRQMMNVNKSENEKSKIPESSYAKPKQKSSHIKDSNTSGEVCHANDQPSKHSETHKKSSEDGFDRNKYRGDSGKEGLSSLILESGQEFSSHASHSDIKKHKKHIGEKSHEKSKWSRKYIESHKSDAVKLQSSTKNKNMPTIKQVRLVLEKLDDVSIERIKQRLKIDDQNEKKNKKFKRIKSMCPDSSFEPNSSFESDSSDLCRHVSVTQIKKCVPIVMSSEEGSSTEGKSNVTREEKPLEEVELKNADTVVPMQVKKTSSVDSNCTTRSEACLSTEGEVEGFMAKGTGNNQSYIDVSVRRSSISPADVQKYNVEELEDEVDYICDKESSQMTFELNSHAHSQDRRDLLLDEVMTRIKEEIHVPQCLDESQESGEEGDVEDNDTSFTLSEIKDNVENCSKSSVPNEKQHGVGETSSRCIEFEREDSVTEIIDLDDCMGSPINLEQDDGSVNKEGVENLQNVIKREKDSDENTKDIIGMINEDLSVTEDKIKEEPDWSTIRYTQEPDVIFCCSDDEDKCTQPIINLDSDSDDEIQQLSGKVKIKDEPPDWSDCSSSSDVRLLDLGYDFSDDESDMGSDFEPEAIFSNFNVGIKAADVTEMDLQEPSKHVEEGKTDIKSHSEENANEGNHEIADANANANAELEFSSSGDEIILTSAFDKPAKTSEYPHSPCQERVNVKTEVKQPYNDKKDDDSVYDAATQIMDNRCVGDYAESNELVKMEANSMKKTNENENVKRRPKVAADNVFDQDTQSDSDVDIFHYHSEHVFDLTQKKNADDVYAAETQVPVGESDIVIEVSSDEDQSTTHPAVVPPDIYQTETQVQDIYENLSDISDSYEDVQSKDYFGTKQTLSKFARRFGMSLDYSFHERNAENNCETELDSSHLPYDTPTQVYQDVDHDNALEKNEMDKDIKEEYFIQTQVSKHERIDDGNQSADDAYNVATQIDFHVDALVDSSSENEIEVPDLGEARSPQRSEHQSDSDYNAFEADTQIDTDTHLKANEVEMLDNEDDRYDMMTQIDDMAKADAEDLYTAATQFTKPDVDQLKDNQEESGTLIKRTAAVKSNRLRRPVSEKASFQSSVGHSSHKKQRIAVEISPQKLKSLAEKRGSGIIVKPPDNGGNISALPTETIGNNSKMPLPSSDFIMLQDASKKDMWLSKEKASSAQPSVSLDKNQPRKRKRRRTNSKEESDALLKAKMQEAKSKQRERNFQSVIHPENIVDSTVKRSKPTAMVCNAHYGSSVFDDGGSSFAASVASVITYTNSLNPYEMPSITVSHQDQNLTSEELEDAMLPTCSQIVRHGLPIVNDTGVRLKSSKPKPNATGRFASRAAALTETILNTKEKVSSVSATDSSLSKTASGRSNVNNQQTSTTASFRSSAEKLKEKQGSSPVINDKPHLTVRFEDNQTKEPISSRNNRSSDLLSSRDKQTKETNSSRNQSDAYNARLTTSHSSKDKQDKETSSSKDESSTSSSKDESSTLKSKMAGSNSSRDKRSIWSVSFKDKSNESSVSKDRQEGEVRLANEEKGKPGSSNKSPEIVPFVSKPSTDNSNRLSSSIQKSAESSITINKQSDQSPFTRDKNSTEASSSKNNDMQPSGKGLGNTGKQNGPGLPQGLQRQNISWKPNSVPAVQTVRQSSRDDQINSSRAGQNLMWKSSHHDGASVSKSTPLFGGQIGTSINWTVPRPGPSGTAHGSTLYQGGSSNFSASGQAQEKCRNWKEFLSVILRWNPLWFEEKLKFSSEGRSNPPEVTHGLHDQRPTVPYPLVERYQSFKEYSEDFMLPLLLYETWESCYNTWSEKKNRNKICRQEMLLNQQGHDGDKNLEFQLLGIYSKADRRNGLGFKESDLVHVRIWEEEMVAGFQERIMDVMGFIEKIEYTNHGPERLCSQNPQFARSLKQDSMLMKLTLKLRKRKLNPSSTHLIELKDISSIVTTFRQFFALSALSKSPLCKAVLRPDNSVTYCDRAPSSIRQLQGSFNRSQSEAINTAAKIVEVRKEEARICLLQGPPGTGKSHTIIGIINNIIKLKKKRSPICLCAPSNAAVDELLRRLYKQNLSQVKSQCIKFVRLGKKSSIHADIQQFSLDSLTEKSLRQAKREELRKRLPPSLQDEIHNLQNKIEALTVKIETAKDRFQKQKCRTDRNGLEKRLADIESRYTTDQNSSYAVDPKAEREMRKKLLTDADIVAGTLSSFGGSQIRNYMYQRGFECVIIDEATQAIELDTLIPLQYGTTKLILVGDPEQLPPTVQSQVAKDNKLDLSLFERLHNHFSFNKEPGRNPVILLDTQYRMDPEISAFPSKYIYEGKLLNDESVKNRHTYGLEPYLLYDIHQGQEVFSQTSKSMSNEAEAIFTAELCNFLVTNAGVVDRCIGVIAPYAKQKEKVVAHLERSGHRHIEVSTVDGFQGREKNVIIMSCVRANTGGGIGFVGSRNRMNVALTRAKYVMYLVGNFESLESSHEWKAVISDAKQRRKIVPVSEASMNSAISRCQKPVRVRNEPVTVSSRSHMPVR